MKLFGVIQPVIGMIHLGALPGAPASARSLREIEAQALKEARVYREAGVHGLCVQAKGLV